MLDARALHPTNAALWTNLALPAVMPKTLLVPPGPLAHHPVKVRLLDEDIKPAGLIQETQHHASAMFKIADATAGIEQFHAAFSTPTTEETASNAMIAALAVGPGRHAQHRKKS